MTTDRNSVTDTLRAAIAASGETVYRIAQRSGVSQGVIGRFLNGERDLRGETINRLAAALNLELREKE